ncbi:MAG: isoprenylcysteine carboxylmethyltransferase family protein [Firmicutes bacterium]|nr:isoprenylcysteine carboxylmethyltransferase family protein [Bacillota bacterium]
MDRAVDGLFLLWLALELFTVRRRPRSRATVRDRGSRWAITGAMLVAVGLANLAVARAVQAGMPPWPPAVRAAGLVVMGAGIALRQWAIRVLGPWFTVRVTVQADQVLVTRGPYRVLRHPAYAGAWLAVIGAGVAIGRAGAAVILAVVPLLGWLYRIRVEEAALSAQFGQAYQEYARRTWRLIPWVY